MEHCWGDKQMGAIPPFAEFVSKGKQGRTHATSIIVVVSYQHLKPGGTKNDDKGYTIDTCPGLLANFSKPVELVDSYGSDLRQACSAELTLPAPTEEGKLLHSPTLLIHARMQTRSTSRNRRRFHLRATQGITHKNT